MERKLLIGCSGFYYYSWRRRFYPDSLSSGQWLPYYASVFNTVELNGTFYKMPKPSDLKKYSLQTPDDFNFAVKASRYITHTLRLKESKTHIEQFSGLVVDGLGDKLNSILYQMPPSFHYNQENIDRIIENIPHSGESVIELRHPSWWNEDVFKHLASANITFCNTDYPGLQQTFTKTTENFYARFHGVPEMFKSEYSEKELERFVDNFPEVHGSTSIYFNNSYFDGAVNNARFLKERMESLLSLLFLLKKSL